MSLNRRKFLQACGLGAGALFLPSLMPRRAKGAEDGPPLRMIFYFTEHGTITEQWQMRPPGVPGSETAAWEADLTSLGADQFSPILEALHPLRQDLLVVDGLALLPAMNDPFGDGHAKGWCSSLTGDWAREQYDDVKSHARSPSVDQIIKASLRQRDPTLTDLVGLEYAIAGWPETFHHLSYAIDGDGNAFKVPQVADPAAAFATLFPTGTADVDPITQSRGNVLDMVSQQYAAMAPKLSSEDRAKLTVHKDLVSDLQKRIAFLSNLQCEAPTLPQAPLESWELWQFEDNNGSVRQWKTDAFVKLIAAAFACRLTQVVTLQAWKAPMDVINGSGDYHHDYAHQSEWGAPQEKIDVVTTAERGHCAQLSQLVAELKSVPEGNGTLFDNTVIVWCSEIATGAHTHDQWPVVILGGANSPFEMGRYVRLPRNVPRPKPAEGWSPDGFVGQPHNKLLVSLAQAMGVDTDHVGMKTIQGFFTDGSSTTIGLTGRLEALYG